MRMDDVGAERVEQPHKATQLPPPQGGKRVVEAPDRNNNQARAWREPVRDLARVHERDFVPLGQLDRKLEGQPAFTAPVLLLMGGYDEYFHVLQDIMIRVFR